MNLINNNLSKIFIDFNPYVSKTTTRLVVDVMRCVYEEVPVMYKVFGGWIMHTDYSKEFNKFKPFNNKPVKIIK